jgi:hypothetical protein
MVMSLMEIIANQPNHSRFRTRAFERALECGPRDEWSGRERADEFDSLMRGFSAEMNRFASGRVQ